MKTQTTNKPSNSLSFPEPKQTTVAQLPFRSGLGFLIFAVFALALIPPVARAQTPVGTAFTYQGRLTDNGSPASGSYDFQFILYNAVAGGAQVGSILTVDDATVTNGLFTAPLDFGAVAFAGQARWLEVGVRAGSSGGAYSVLSPRQELTVTPGAIFASAAATATTAGSYSGNLLRIESVSNANNPVLEIKDNSPGQTRNAAINFLQTNNTVRGQIAYQNPDGPMTFRVGGANLMTLSATGLDINAGQVTFGSVEGFKDAGVNLIGTIGIDSLAIGGRIHTGSSTNAFAWNQFGNGTKTASTVNDVNDVFIAGDIELGGTTMSVPDGFTINVGGSAANFTIAGANAILQIGDTASDKVGIDRTPTVNSLEVEGNASKTTAGSWLANSDRRLKTDIQEVQGALEVIDRLRPVKFRYNPEFFKKHPGTRDISYYNYIAQEYQQVFPDSVQDDGEGYLQLDTHNAGVYSVAAIQELHQALKQKDAQIARLEKQVQTLQETVNVRMAALEQAVHSSPDRKTVKTDR
jgi:hypothetical protein